jgi:hypothetical protein
MESLLPLVCAPRDRHPGARRGAASRPEHAKARRTPACPRS